MHYTDTRVPLKPDSIVIDRFKILDDAPGGGTFGLTYKALDLSNDANVALKEYYPKYGAVRANDGINLIFSEHDSAPDLGLFRKEAKALARCPSYPGIAQFFLADIANGTGYLALEWIDGDVLTKKTSIDDATLKNWFLQLVDAILHLGKANLAHRDIKPENIMIRSDGSAVLVDLGAARLVSGGATFDTKTKIFSPAFAAPEQFTAHGYQNVWTDLFGLSAAFYSLVCGEPPVKCIQDSRGWVFDELKPPLHIRRLEGEAGLDKYDLNLLRAIDMGLEVDLRERPRAGLPYLRVLDISEEQLHNYLPQRYLDASNLLIPPEPLKHDVDTNFRPAPKEKESVLFSKYQTAIVQSLDAARFQDSSFLTRLGEDRDNTPNQKIALARTEVFLNLIFGREVVIPAGHIADSEAVFAILKEMLGLYQDKFQSRIDQACSDEGMPIWRPFRIAIEDSKNRDGYIGFVASYKYTGAPMPLLQAAGRSDGLDFEKLKEAGVEHVRKLFLAGDYDGLEKAVRKNNYGAYAARVARYFSHETSVFPIDKRPIETVTAYVDVFRSHLDNNYISGSGVEDAQQKLPLIEKIEADLNQFVSSGLSGVTGFRGNWYHYAKMFEDVWPLARGYLDAKLYLSLSSKYGIDHPVLISQAFEYGRFDHSLILGPKFGKAITEEPKLDAGLYRLTKALTGPFPWEQLFEMYLNPKFLYSISELNRSYISGNLKSYQFAVERHAELVSREITGISINVDSGLVSISPSTDSKASLALQSYVPILEADTRSEMLLKSGSSVFPNFGVEDFDAAGVTLLPLADELDCLANGDPQLMHYFIKPLKLKEFGV